MKVFCISFNITILLPLLQFHDGDIPSCAPLKLCVPYHTFYRLLQQRVETALANGKYDEIPLFSCRIRLMITIVYGDASSYQYQKKMNIQQAICLYLKFSFPCSVFLFL